MKKVEDLSAYQVLEKREITDIKSISYLVRHKKTGARLALLSNDDNNKVFYIGFRTPPKDSTGVAHILEHSVLCGSREVPVKDPFVELVKGSLNTFLNAITYSDKTIYPVASCNDKDFQNLMHVYLDAVFYPNIYRKEAIFRQEGWHYELDGETGELTYNGVVYNEMKGAFSSPDEVLGREILNSLYPHTPYGCESGGDPEVIPELTYEQFLAFHTTYYHPSNSYIYLYGDMDMAEKLEFIDEHYLSSFKAMEVDSRINLEPAFSEPARLEREYPLNEGENAEDNTFLAWNLSVGDCLDRELYVAFQILDYALCSAPGAPLKQALVDRGLGKDVYSNYYRGLRQPGFSVISKGISLDREQEFLSVIREVLTGIVKDGFNEKALLAGINHYEFQYREADYGSTPKGLMYGIQMLESWLHDDNLPFIHIEANNTYASMREKMKQGYFENLIQKYFLDNPHASTVLLKPVAGLGEKQEEALKAKLAEKKRLMTEEQLKQVRDMVDKLNDFRETPDRPEDIAKLPRLSVADIRRDAEKLVNRKTKLGEIPVLHHDLATNGIGYLRLIFSCDGISEELFPYVALLKGCLVLVNTQNYTYGDLANEINLYTGGITPVINVYEQVNDLDRYTVTLELKTKALYENLGKAVSLMEEILLTSDFTDTKRLYEILAEGRSQMQAAMTSMGHSVAMVRAASYVSTSGAANERLGGISFYRLVTELEADFEEKKEQLVQNLVTLSRMIFRPENLMVDFVGEEKELAGLEAPVANLVTGLFTQPVEKSEYTPTVEKKNEGFMTAAQVQYVCRAGDFRRKNLPYHGALKVLNVLMEYEYLWTNVRVKGGAYGCMCGFRRSGDCYFVSYRDPNLQKTIDVYENASAFVKNFEADESTMAQYIIGAVGEMDKPMNPAAKGLYSLSAYMCGLTDEMLKEEREQVLSADQDSIRKLSGYIDAFMGEDCLCVVGNAQKIKEEEKIFKHIENLF